MKISDVLKVVLSAVVLVASISGCDVQSFEDAEREFRNGSPPPPAPPPPGPPPPPPPPPPVTFGPTFTEIQANVFTPDCASAGCHGAASAGGLNLEPANSYAMLVGIASVQEPGIMQVAPNNPDASYLIQKMEGTALQGAIMPPGAALPQSTIDIVRQWITNGALDNTPPPPVVAPVRVTSLSVPLNAVLTAGPAQIIAGFDRVLDASTVNLNTFTLTASGGDGTFTDGNEALIPATSIAIGANPQSAVFDLTGTVLADDTYRISLLGAGGSVIMDLDANALDGEFAGVFPSGNGTAGGTFLSQFSVSTPVVIGPTLDQIQAVVFTPSCATVGCHTGPSGGVLPSGMDLSDADASFLALVGIASIQDPVTLRVAAGDPVNSYLIQKLEGNAGFGAVMPPPPRQPLDPAVIAEIRQWILDGALR